MVKSPLVAPAERVTCVQLLPLSREISPFRSVFNVMLSTGAACIARYPVEGALAAVAAAGIKVILGGVIVYVKTMLLAVVDPPPPTAALISAEYDPLHAYTCVVVDRL